MRHVDEGQLHAFLDGELVEEDAALATEIEQHLSACESCRSELEGVRELRRRGKELLEGNVAFPLVQPPFEEVIARSRKGQAPARPVWAPRRLAWAASIAVALGAGWLARGLITPDISLERVAIEQESRAAADAASAEPLDMSVQSSAAEAEQKIAASPEADEVARSLAAVSPGQANVEPPTETQELAVALPSPPPPPSAANPTQPGPAATAARQDQVVALEGVVAPGFSGARAGAAAQAGPASAPAVADFDGAATARTWTRVDAARATAILGVAPLAVPDLPVVAIEVASSDGAQIVRVRQDLGAGREIALEQQRRIAANGASLRASASAAEASAQGVGMERGGLVVTITGPGSPAELRALLERAR